MEKVKILCLSIWYPLSMSRYFEKALRHNPNIDLKTVGAFTGSWIPWTDAQHPSGMNVPERYAKSPDLPMFRYDMNLVNYEAVEPHLEGWIPDIVMAIDAGVNWVSKPKHGMVITVATDPHVLPYDRQRSISDKFFNMQKCYSQGKDIYLPYAYSAYDHHYELSMHLNENGNAVSDSKDIDAMLVGLQYTHVPRVQWIEELRKLGLNIFTENGPIFDEYRAIANRARIGLNWSTMNDLNARFFETPAFGLPMVANRVPDAHLFLNEDKDYLAFTTLPEAIEKVMYLKNNPEKAEQIAQNGHKKIQPHTYDARVEQILKECGF